MSAETPDVPSLLDRVSEDTLLTYGQLAMIGSALLDNIVTVMTMGWTSPVGSLDYTTDSSDKPFTDLVVRDYIVWISGRKDKSPDAEKRLRVLVEASDWQKHVFAQMAASLPDGVERRAS